MSQARKSRYRALQAAAQARFPLAFPPYGQPRPPLVVGAAEALAAAMGWELDDSRALLRVWCAQPSYLAAVAAGLPRVGLDGAAAAPAEPAHRRAAAGARRDKLRRAAKCSKSRRAQETRAAVKREARAAGLPIPPPPGKAPGKAPGGRKPKAGPGPAPRPARPPVVVERRVLGDRAPPPRRAAAAAPKPPPPTPPGKPA